MKSNWFRCTKHFVSMLIVLSSFSGVTYADTTNASATIEKMYVDDNSVLHIVSHSLSPNTVSYATAKLVTPANATLSTSLMYDKTSDSWIPVNGIPLKYGEWKCTGIGFDSETLTGNFVFYMSASNHPHPWYIDVNNIKDSDSVLTGYSIPGSTITVEKNGQTLGTGITGTDSTFSISIGKQAAGTSLRIVGKTDYNPNPIDITVSVQSTSPAIPLKVDPYSQSDWAVRGNVTAGSTLVVESGEKTLGTGTANLDGSFSIAIPPQQAGTPLMVLAEDATGTTIGLQEIVVHPSPSDNHQQYADTNTDSNQFPMIQTNTGISVSVNGNFINFDTAPVLVANRTLVPVRGVFEALGAKVEWDNGTVRVFSDTHSVTLQIGSETAYVDGKPVQLEISPILIDSRAFVPVRFISEAIGANVDWDGKNHKINITLQKK